METTDFLTFDEYVRGLQDAHIFSLRRWIRSQRVAEIVREHGGDEFRDYCINDDCMPAVPESPTLPHKPLLRDLAPGSRVTLVTLLGDDYAEWYCKSHMVVFSIDNETIEGFIYDGDVARGHYRINQNQVIKCTPPLGAGETEKAYGKIDTDFDDQIPF